MHHVCLCVCMYREPCAYMLTVQLGVQLSQLLEPATGDTHHHRVCEWLRTACIQAANSSPTSTLDNAVVHIFKRITTAVIHPRASNGTSLFTHTHTAAAAFSGEWSIGTYIVCWQRTQRLVDLPQLISILEWSPFPASRLVYAYRTTEMPGCRGTWKVSHD